MSAVKIRPGINQSCVLTKNAPFFTPSFMNFSNFNKKWGQLFSHWTGPLRSGGINVH
jgi:hypothetical protein